VGATQSRIVVLAINNAGTIELAAVNSSGGKNLTETGLITTTAEGGAGAADSGTVVYSTTGRTNLAYRVVGYVESTQATAGTWATAPSTVQGAGGNAITAMSSLGYGQTWQDLIGSRSLGVTYYNTTGKPIMVSARVSAQISSQSLAMQVNGIYVDSMSWNVSSAAVSSAFGVRAIVPDGASYLISGTGSAALDTWSEMR
jgi:hypothetical protein